MTQAGYVYIMANRRNGTIYTGVTSDLAKRVTQHRSEENPDWNDLFESICQNWTLAFAGEPREQGSEASL